MSSRPLRAAIVGGGIGGLSAANALLRRGLDVTVYEQASKLGEVGAGLAVFPNALRVLERMGLKEALARVGAKYGEGSEYYRMDGTPVAPITTTDSSGWNGIHGLHRADLLDVLADALPEGTVRTSHKCVDFEQDADEARLTFANGETATADVVIAADGIHSVLQKHVVETARPVHSGSVAYRGLLEADKLPGWRKGACQLWMGQGKHFMTYPVRSGTLINYVAFIPTSEETRESWSAVGDRDKLAAEFTGWDPRVTGLLEKVETCFWWGLYDRQPLDTWTNGRLVLLGDAAHAMLPHLGQGANQAIEDGVALGVLLEGQTPGRVAEILPHYEKLRRERAYIVQGEARRNGHRYDSNYKDLHQRDTEVKNSAELRWWIFDYDVEKAALEYRAEHLEPARA